MYLKKVVKIKGTIKCFLYREGGDHFRTSHWVRTTGDVVIPLNNLPLVLSPIALVCTTFRYFKMKGLLLTHRMIEYTTASDKWSMQAMLSPG